MTKKLLVYAWPEYFAPGLIAEFERSQECSVEVATFSSNEELFTNIDSGLFQFDVLTPSSYMAERLHRMNKLSPLDAKIIPHSRWIDREYLAQASDPAMEYSVPFEISVSGIGFVDRNFRPAKHTWHAFENPEIRLRYTLLDDMREVLGAALKVTGKSVNSKSEADLRAAASIAKQWMHTRRLLNSESYRFGLVAGEDLLVHAYSGDIFAGMNETNGLRFFVPEEGAPMACDDFCIPSNAKQRRLAHAFIDFFCQPQVAAANMKWSGFRAPIPEALRHLSPDLLANPTLFPRKEVLERCETQKDVGDSLPLWESIWEELLNVP